jgi:hypothetical protein
LYIHKSGPAKKKKKTKSLKILKPRKAVICLECGKNKSQVREIWGAKPERVESKNGRRILDDKQGCFLCIREKRHIVGQNRAVFSQELHTSYV